MNRNTDLIPFIIDSFSLTVGFLEYTFLGIHNRIHTELNVIVLGGVGPPGEDGAHMTEFTHAIDDEEQNIWSKYAGILQKCHLTLEEVTLIRGIVLTFTGNKLTKTIQCRNSSNIVN